MSLAEDQREFKLRGSGKKTHRSQQQIHDTLLSDQVGPYFPNTDFVMFKDITVRTGGGGANLGQDH